MLYTVYTKCSRTEYLVWVNIRQAIQMRFVYKLNEDV